MRNTDNLKSALFGLSLWNCRPRPPEALAACWPLTSRTDVQDLSRWNNSLGFTPKTGSADADSSASGLAPVSLPDGADFLFKLNLEKPWSLEFRIRINHGNDRGSFSTFQIGGLSFSPGYRGESDYAEVGYAAFSGDGVSNVSGGIALRSSERHFAVAYSDGIVRAYVDGAFSASASVSLSGTSDRLTLTRNSIWNFGNFRAVQKRLGTDSAYPVTNAFFTGLETL